MTIGLERSKVAFRSGSGRATNLAGVLQDIDAEINWKKYRRILIKPNFVSVKNRVAATHIDATRTLLKHIRDRFAGEIWLIEGGADEPRLQGFINFGYQQLIDEFDVSLHEVGEGETVSLNICDRHLQPLSIKVDKTILESEFIISITPPKVHNVVIFTGALKNLIMGSLIIEKSPTNPGEIGFSTRLKKWLQKKLHSAILKSLNILPKYYAQQVRLNTEVYFNLVRPWHQGNSRVMMHQGYPVMNFNLFLVARHLRPHLSIIDGFEGMEGEGPINGTPVHLGYALAGTDAVAVDSVAAHLMGINPQNIGYLFYCDRYGVGRLDRAHIELLGTSDLASAIVNVKLHPIFPKQLKWRSKKIEQLIQTILK
jgi:uncharacterized protein (DUF362 family)